MTEHAHDHGDGGEEDLWAEQHARVGALREPELEKATKVLLAAARVIPGSRVLDVACGAGDTTAAATREGADATGVDASPAMVRIARSRFPGTRFVEGDMAAPPAGPWDAIVCRLGAHHADPSWLSAAFAVLAPGGRLAIAEREVADDTDRERGMKTIAEWVTLLQDAGLQEVAVMPSGAFLPGPIHVVSGTKGDSS